MSYCEDYPCCGHTPADPCERQWYDEPDAFNTRVNPHAFCEHDAGYCDAPAEFFGEPEDGECCESGDANRTAEGWVCSWCHEPVAGPDEDAFPMEDQWLDSYMEDRLSTMFE